MADKGDDVTVAILEGVNEGFAWFLRQSKDQGFDCGTTLLPMIRWTFQIAFLKGVVWTKRQSREQAKLPRN